MIEKIKSVLSNRWVRSSINTLIAGITTDILIRLEAGLDITSGVFWSGFGLVVVRTVFKILSESSIFTQSSKG